MAAKDELQRNVDGLTNQIAAAAVYINPASGVEDDAVGIKRSVSGDLVCVDQVVAQQPTLAQVMYAQASIAANITMPANFTWFERDISIANGITLFLPTGATLALI